MTTALTPRKALPEDVPALRALHLKNWRRDYAALVPEAVMQARLGPWMAGYWGAGLPRGLVVLAVEDAGTLLGFVGFDPDRDGGSFIENLHVAPEARGRGVGRALMADVAKAAPGSPIRLEVMAGNTAARATYSAWGGVEGAPFDGSLLAHPQPEVPVSWGSGRALLQALGMAAR